MQQRVSVELEVAATHDRVWEVITDPAEIERWHGWEYPGLDEEIAEIFGTGASADPELSTSAD